MKKILAVVLAVLIIVSVPVSYAATCSHEYTYNETYDYYYDCGDGTHKYVYGYNIRCSECREILYWEDTYEDPDGTPHSYGADGYCCCGHWDGVTETNPPY